MKKILLLGGSKQQVPAIKNAKELGYHTILCDYLPDNPGQTFADEFYCISTTDMDAVLEIAMRHQIDGILAYASDPAALTAAYVGTKMGLPTNPYEAVSVLSRKDLFRKFLRENGFNCPKAGTYGNIEEASLEIDQFHFPVMVKPVDSSGSKGITCIFTPAELPAAFDIAMAKSRESWVILEEYIQMDHECMIGGDGFVLNGKLQFFGVLNSHRKSRKYSLVPIGTSYPPFISDDQLQRVYDEVQKLLNLLNYQFGGINLELMFDSNDQLYILEIGPRNGGNMIPELLKMITGVDLVIASIEASLGNKDIRLAFDKREGFFSTFVIHSDKKGIFSNISYADEVKHNLVKEVLYKKAGTEIDTFESADKALGIVFLKFDSLEELQNKMRRMDQLVTVKIAE